MIIVLLADGFEEIEALAPVNMLRRAGLTVKTVGVTGKAPTGSHGIAVVCDATPEEIDLSKVTMAIFPGGMPGASNLNKSDFTDEVIDAVIKNDGRLAAICAAPLILGKRGLLRGKKATCYPGFENTLRGATVVDEAVVTDGMITTAKGMGVALDFAKELITLCLNDEEANKVADSIFMSKKSEAETIIFPETNEDEEDRIEKLLESLLMKDSNDNGNKFFDIVPSVQESANDDEDETAPVVEVKEKPDYSNYQLPSLELLKSEDEKDADNYQEEIQECADKIIETLEAFGVSASVVGVERGPRITRFEIAPAKGIKVSSIINLADDITLNLAVGSIRMEAPIPGRSAVGIEIPNKKADVVRLRNILETEEFVNAESKTSVCIGRDIAGKPVLGDIAKMPHALIGGATGMGKSVCINDLIVSMLYKAKPDEVKLILVDPKQVEFTAYNDLPHLLVPVIFDPKKAAGALMWAVDEMERRYNLMRDLGVRNIDLYNEKTDGEHLPKIVIIIDELADLMLQVKDPIETLIMRIAQKARAAGIHLIIGTQRPSVNVITGVIKANVPTRLSFKVMSQVDSKTLLDTSSAEKLLDKGDGLYCPAGASKPFRIQCAFVSDGEVENIVDSIKSVAGPDYDAEVINAIELAVNKICSSKRCSNDEDEDNTGYLNDRQFLDAVEVAVSTGKISTSLIQRKLSIGYGKAAKFIDIMEDMGIVSEAQGQRPRTVLMSKDEWRAALARIYLED